MAKREIPPYETRDWPEGTAIKMPEVCQILDLSPKTIMRYVEQGKLRQWKNQINGRTYFDKAQVMTILGAKPNQIGRKNILYTRVSKVDHPGKGNGAQDRLEAQTARMVRYCTNSGIRIDEVIQDTRDSNDLGSSPHLDNIMEMVLRKEIGIIVVETLDRLGRFDSTGLWEKFFQWHGVHLHVVNEVLPLEEYRQEIKEDLANIIYQVKVDLGEIKEPRR